MVKLLAWVIISVIVFAIIINLNPEFTDDLKENVKELDIFTYAVIIFIAFLLLQRHRGRLHSFQFKKSKYREPKKDVENKRRKYRGYCEHCNEKVSFPDYFYCKYCKKYHCDKHRLPEQHDCSGNPVLPEEMK